MQGQNGVRIIYTDSTTAEYNNNDGKLAAANTFNIN